MPRSATDATRFTSTTPYAASKPPPNLPNLSRNHTPPRTPGPPGETPQEKVKRLRAAADRARFEKIDPIDKWIVRGRVWADRAHRFTALSLIGISVICAGVTCYALGDMIMFNRRKRAEFFSEQKAMHEAAVHNAREAIGRGNATEAQLDFIKKVDEEDAKLKVLKLQRMEKKGIFASSKDWLLSGLKKDEHEIEPTGVEATPGSENASGAGKGGVLQAIEERKDLIRDEANKAFENEKQQQRRGGMLDQLGTSIAEENGFADSKRPSKSWISWITG